MEALPDRIQELRKRIEQDTKLLHSCEQQWNRYCEQKKARELYLSSKEIRSIIQAQTGRSCGAATIKRWADDGLLGEVREERAAFPDLIKTQGNKRFLFDRARVYAFLFHKGLLRPKYDILDEVEIDGYPAPIHGIVVSSKLANVEFLYTIQMEATGNTMSDVAEYRIRPR